MICRGRLIQHNQLNNTYDLKKISWINDDNPNDKQKIYNGIHVDHCWQEID